MRRYAMESGFLSRLLSDRKEVLGYARALGTAEAMRAAREDLMASTRVNVAPTADNPLKLEVVDGIAHIPIVGELTPSARTDACGAYTAEALTEYGFIRASLAEADARSDVEAIALDVDSPGGYIAGLDETAQALAAVSKPTTAYVGSMAASAAYWLASQADRIVALSPASEVGSIGVACEEYDDDEALARDGIAHRIYTSTDAPDKRPDTATDEGRSKIIAELDALHAVFVRRVADGRHVAAEKVSKDFGRGGVLTAEKAVAAGMIDEVRGSHLSRPKLSTAGVASSAAATSAAISPKEVRMDLNQLKAEHPDLVATIAAEGKAVGISEERARVAALRKWADADPQNAKVAAIVKEAEAQGKTEADVQPQLLVAMRSAVEETPEAVATAPATTASGMKPEDEDKLVADATTLAKIVR